MNKRGDVSTILLFVVAFALVLSSLYVFVSFNGKFESSRNLTEMTSESDLSYKYVITEAELIGKDAVLGRVADCTQGDITQRFSCVADKREKLSIAGNFFGKIRNGEFSFVPSGGNYVLKISGLTVKTSRGASSIEKNFDLEIAFDGNGKIVYVKTGATGKT